MKNTPDSLLSFYRILFWLQQFQQQFLRALVDPKETFEGSLQ